VGKVTVNRKPLYVCNVHAHASLSEKPEYREKLKSLKDAGTISEKEYRSYTARYDAERKRIRSEISNVLAGIEKHVPSGAPVILLGDFNSLEDSVPVQMITGRGFIDTYRIANPDKEGFTWDSTNPLVANDTILPEDLKDDHLMRIAYGDWNISQRIDYIFVGGPFRPEDVLESRVIMDRPVDGQYPSDHFGVMTRIALPE
jgi:endonuclease/exonuclease/phosphatase family metal-dependent hydrolase